MQIVAINGRNNMAIGAFRNKKCYCGSGKKFKDCHLIILNDAKAKGDQGILYDESPEAYLNREKK